MELLIGFLIGWQFPGAIILCGLIMALFSGGGSGNRITPEFSKKNAKRIERFKGPSRDPLIDGFKALAAKLSHLVSKGATP